MFLIANLLRDSHAVVVLPSVESDSLVRVALSTRNSTIAIAEGPRDAVCQFYCGYNGVCSGSRDTFKFEVTVFVLFKGRPLASTLKDHVI